MSSSILEPRDITSDLAFLIGRFPRRLRPPEVSQSTDLCRPFWAITVVEHTTRPPTIRSVAARRRAKFEGPCFPGAHHDFAP